MPYWHYCTLCFFLILLCIFGCGGAEDTYSADEDSSENLVGTWELITIDGETPKADAQNNLKSEETEVLALATKMVLASDGALFQDALLTVQTLIEASPNSIYIKSQIRQTVEGRYVVSGSTIELIRSGDDVRITTHTSWKTPGNPELKQQLEQDPDSEEFRQGFEAGLKDELQKNADNWALQLSTNTFDLEADLLTLINGSERVFKKR
ncbi:hypothetical protein F4054_06895 [Candidatus Poribacteria bacterium]|nr:hypothetical protein [Candidatus Poribacteria bacterium]MYF52406.1 hypothetical protein [Gammaproteobacteria bacterium]MYK21970.1 hypothetical protein [Candidatus Poribacteria bacterium]